MQQSDDRYRMLVDRGANLVLLCVLADDATAHRDYLNRSKACLLRAMAQRGTAVEIAAADILTEARRRLFLNVLPRLGTDARRELAADFRRAENALVERPTVH
jgi:hypothetical protein